LLEHIEHHYDGARQARTRLLVRLLGDEGLRISEAANLHVEDIDMRNRQLYVRRGKGGKTRTLPLSQACYHALREWLNMRPAHARADEATLLVNVGKKVKKTRRGKAMHVNTIRLELDRLYKQLGFGQRYRGAHMLRHTAGTRLYQQTRDLHVVSQILGHSDVNTSSIYAKMDRRGLEDAMRKLDDADQDDQAEANHFANRNKYNPQEGNRHDGKRADVLQDKLDEVADEISEGVLEDMQPQSQTNNHNANDHDPDA
jgi:integrase/recombinase XerC